MANLDAYSYPRTTMAASFYSYARPLFGTHFASANFDSYSYSCPAG